MIQLAVILFASMALMYVITLVISFTKPGMDSPHMRFLALLHAVLFAAAAMISHAYGAIR